MGKDVKLCIVKGCKNKSSEGNFVGNMCVPCYEFVTEGKGTTSQAYRNAWETVKKEKEGHILKHVIEEELEKLWGKQITLESEPLKENSKLAYLFYMNNVVDWTADPILPYAFYSSRLEVNAYKHDSNPDNVIYSGSIHLYWEHPDKGRNGYTLASFWIKKKDKSGTSPEKWKMIFRLSDNTMIGDK